MDIYRLQAKISIHAPSRERHSIYLAQLGKFEFQSTLPHGSDHKATALGHLCPYFNPRSLTGATVYTLFCIWFCCYFNPRSLTGATAAQVALPAGAGFQSTLPHGSDACRIKARRVAWNFNPRSLTGATLVQILVVLPNSYFNPRSLTGATPDA